MAGCHTKHAGRRVVEVPAMEMQFGVLSGLKRPGPCDPFGDSSTFCAWSSVTEGGQVVARDSVPDAAWLPISLDEQGRR
jgi:hypothetical protein